MPQVTPPGPDRRSDAHASADVGADVGAEVAAGEARADRVPVSTLELFFDLVFVFTITQLTAALAVRSTPAGLLSVVIFPAAAVTLLGRERAKA